MSKTIDIKYPVYSGEFISEDKALITGGGGDGNYGIPNKISLLKINFTKDHQDLKVVDEYEFPGKNDSPTGIAMANDTVLVSINENNENIKKGSNKNLRKFKFDETSEKSPFEPVASIDTTDSKDPAIYTKKLSISKDGKTAVTIATKVPGVLHIIDPTTLEIKDTITMPKEEEINDVAISPKGDKIAYITNRKLTILQDGEAPILEHSRFSPNYILKKVEFNTNESVIVGVELRSGRGVLLLQSSIMKDTPSDYSPEEQAKDPEAFVLKTKKAKVISDRVKKIVALTVTNNDLVAVATNDSSILIASADNFDVYRTLSGIHNFAISDLSFSPSGKYLLSTSVSNTVNVWEVPSNVKFSLKPYINAAIVLIIAALITYGLRQVTQEQWDNFNDIMLYLHGEEPIQRTTVEEQDTVSVTETVFETVTVGAPASAMVHTSIETNTEYVVEQGDIVSAKAESLVKEHFEEAVSNLI